MPTLGRDVDEMGDQGVNTVESKRLGYFCEAKGLLPEEQYGFRPHRSTLDVMFAVRRLQELGREAHVPLCLCFIDLQKAYDFVDRSLLWQKPTRYGVPRRLIAVIRQFHDGLRAWVKNDNGDCSGAFNVEQGLRKRFVLSPLFFNIFFAVVLLVALQRFSEDPGI